jgi:HPt (histidine-containing phosphotransfer) domain-containing protein
MDQVMEARRKIGHCADSAQVVGSAEDPLPRGDLSLIDQRPLDEIRRLAASGDPGLLTLVVDLYLEESRRLMQVIRRSTERGDASSMRVAAHTLKSSSARLGANGLFELCTALERLAGNGSTEGAEPLVRQLEHFHPLVCRALRSAYP